jgi:hypothetical protein
MRQVRGQPRGDERLMDVVAALRADDHAPELPLPAQRVLRDPAMPPQPATRLDAHAGDAPHDALATEEATPPRNAVGRAGMKLGRSLPRPTPCVYAIEAGFDDGALPWRLAPVRRHVTGVSGRTVILWGLIPVCRDSSDWVRSLVPLVSYGCGH